MWTFGPQESLSFLWVFFMVLSIHLPIDERGQQSIQALQSPIDLEYRVSTMSLVLSRNFLWKSITESFELLRKVQKQVQGNLSYDHTKIIFPKVDYPDFKEYVIWPHPNSYRLMMRIKQSLDNELWKEDNLWLPPDIVLARVPLSMPISKLKKMSLKVPITLLLEDMEVA